MKKKIIVSLIATSIIVLLVLLSVLFWKNNNKTFVGLNEKFTLKKSEIVYFKLDTKEIKIKLNKIVDNSCPREAQCIWEGAYIVSITVGNITHKMGTLSATERIYSLEITDSPYTIYLSEERNKDRATFIITEKEAWLTEQEIMEMQAVDDYIADIKNSEAFTFLDFSEQVTYMKTQLDKLTKMGVENFSNPLIKSGSISLEEDEHNTMIYFEYACGVLGAVQIDSSNLTYEIDNNLYYYDSSYSQRGVYYDTLNTLDTSVFYTIAMGMRSTGGYAITVESVNIDENDNVEVIVKESSPSPEDIVTEALTYPICKLILTKAPKSIVFKNTVGEEFDHLNFS